MGGRDVRAHPEALQVRSDLPAPSADVTPADTVAPDRDHPGSVVADSRRTARRLCPRPRREAR
jgi:hypothetical protein